MNVSEEKHTVGVQRFNRARDDDFHLCCLRMQAALRGKRIVMGLTNAGVEGELNDDALSSILCGFGDKLLYTIQNCNTAKNAWDKLQGRYAGKTLMDKPGVL